MRMLVASFIALMAVTAVRGEEPLDRVPSSAGVFAHLRFGDVWNSPFGVDVRKSLGDNLTKASDEFKKNVGMPLEILDTATFCFPNMPQGPGDEQTFMVIVTTVKPYDRDALLPDLREKDAKPVGNMLALKQKFNLQFVSDTMFVVMHDSLKEKFAKGGQADDGKGPVAEALKAAKAKQHFVFALDFSKLPNEILTAAPPEAQPFLPLLKTKSNCFAINLKDREFKITANFTGNDANSTEDAEKSFKLLMTLAGAGLSAGMPSVEKRDAYLVPLLKELKRSVDGVTVNRTGDRLETALTLKADVNLDKVIEGYTKQLGSAGSTANNNNNLRQIGLAMHAYHDAHSTFPPAAICDKKGRPLLSWRVAILPYIEQDALYKQFRLDEPWDSEHNKALINKMPAAYALKDLKPNGKTHYRVFTGPTAVFDLLQSSTIAQIADGSSNTVMVVESADATEWTKPDDIEYDAKLPIEKLLRFVDDKTTVAMCDGSVRSIKKGLGDKTWRMLIERADGNVIPDF